jgi:superfamily II DNA or RNA helicase
MVQTLARADGVEGLLSGYGHIVVDECHHVPAVMTERVLAAAPARYVTGLTATPQRRDGHDPIIAWQCGPVRHRIDSGTQTSAAGLALRVVARETAFEGCELPVDASIQEVYTALAHDEQRTELIASDVCALVGVGRSPIVLTERRGHLEFLRERLISEVPSVIALHGQLRPAERRAALERLRDEASGARVILATGRYLGEGFDEPRLDTLLLALPIAWKGTIVQYAGRLQRAHPGKRDVLIYDYVDRHVPVLRRMFAKRAKAYAALGYQLDGYAHRQMRPSTLKASRAAQDALSLATG